MESLAKNETWVLVNKLEGAKILAYKWLYKKKEGTWC